MSAAGLPSPIKTPAQGFWKASFIAFSLLTALLELGALLGALMAGFIADKYSRRISIAVGLAWFIVGSIIQTLSYHYGTLVIGRALGGVGIGLLSSTAPMYVAEVRQAVILDPGSVLC